MCWSKGDIGGAKRPEGNQRGGVASVSWVIIDVVVLTCMCVSNINNDDDDEVVIIIVATLVVRSHFWGCGVCWWWSLVLFVRARRRLGVVMFGAWSCCRC